LTARRAILLFAALAILTAFYPAFFGELPVPAGGARLIVPGGSPPEDRNDELGDVPTQFLPWTTAVADAYRAGRLPLRFAANGCGTPLWANPQAQAVTPTTLFSILFGSAWGFGAAAAFKLFLAAAGGYFFARARALSHAASAWTGLAFGFAVQMTAWMHFPHTWPIALLPFALLALERLASGRRGGFAATTAVVALLLCGGYPEGEFFVALCGCAWFAALLLSRRDPAGVRLRRAGLAAAAALLGLGLTAAYTLPATLAIARGERSVQVARWVRTLEPSFSARDFVRPPTYWDVTRFWVVPEAQGNPRDEDKFGPYSFAGRASGYAGVLVLAFALATFFWRKAPRTVRLARAGVVLSALYLLWYPPLVFLLQATPGISHVATRLTSNRANAILVLLVALLAGFQLDRIRAAGRTAATPVALAIVLAATALVFREHQLSPERLPLTAWRSVRFLLPAILLLAAFLLATVRSTPRRLRALAAFLLAATALDLARIGARFNPGTQRADYFPVTPKVRALQEASRGGRFADSGISLTGMAAMYGLEDLRAHDPVAPADYQDVLAATAGYTGPGDYTARVANLEAPILAFLDTRAVVGPGAEVRARTGPAPQAILPDELAGSSDSGALLRALAAETDFLRRAHVVGENESFSGPARLVSYVQPRPEEIRVRIEADSPRVLVVPVTTDGGWTARAGGRPLATFAANGAFLAVRVPAGATEVVCRYTPPGFRTGLGVSAGSALVLAVLAWRRFRRGGRSSSRSSEGAGAPRAARGTAPTPHPRRPGGEASACAGPP
jgi:hypothetical protein